jgi:hypothetical protein
MWPHLRKYSGPSSYNEQLGLRPKILVLTYDQSLELRPACRSRPLELRHTRVCGRNAGQCIALYN